MGGVLRTYTGTAHYRRRVTIPQEWGGGRIRLGFGAVDYRAVVEVNGTHVGNHEGGYLPFDFEIQDVARAGADAIIDVTVSDDMAPDIPKGKQSWYGPLAGIWQSVWLERTADSYIAGMRVSSDPSSGRVTLAPDLRGGHEDLSYRLLIRGPGSVEVEADDLTTTVGDVRLWDLETPNLYQAELSIHRGQEVIDAHTETFGFRTVEARDGKIWLNDRPVFLVGALDQDYYPDTMCTPPSDAFLRLQIERAKELGLNCLRCHIKVPDPRYLEWADRLGMLIWEELPSWEEFTSEAARRGRETLEGMIARDGNHPSIVAWSIMNESWGIDLVGEAAQRAWLNETVDLVRTSDPTRMIVDNSPCMPNFHVRSDLNDFHFYAALPDQRARWDGFIEGWTSDPSSTYSSHGDAVRRGDEPMIVSEFGNWGLPDPAGLSEDDGSDPWWFDTGADWAGGVVHPTGVLERARELRLDETFGGMSEVFVASQQHQFESIQYEVEQMRLRPQIAGFVVTEFTDIYWECNGLLDLHRRPKAGHAAYRWIFGSDLPICVPDRRRCFVGEQIVIRLHAAHASSCDLTQSTLRWISSEGARGEHPVDVAPWSASKVGEPTLMLDIPGRHRIELELVDAGGALLGRNWIDITVYDRPRLELPAWSDDEEVLRFLKTAGFSLDERDGVRVSPGLDDQPERGVLLAGVDDEGAGVRGIGRTGTSWEADWAQGMHWIGDALRRGTPQSARVDLTCSGLIPEAVLDGADLDRSLAGMYVGWIHDAVATAAELKPGLLATTFPILQAGPHDPMAVWLLFNLLREAIRA
jgi:hypothetical protein